LAPVKGEKLSSREKGKLSVPERTTKAHRRVLGQSMTIPWTDGGSGIMTARKLGENQNAKKSIVRKNEISGIDTGGGSAPEKRTFNERKPGSRGTMGGKGDKSGK